MNSKLQEAIDLVQSLSFAEQLELLKTLSIILQQSHSQETQNQSETDTNFSVNSFRTSWQQAVTGQTLPLSQLWENSEVD